MKENFVFARCERALTLHHFAQIISLIRQGR